MGVVEVEGQMVAVIDRGLTPEFVWEFARRLHKARWAGGHPDVIRQVFETCALRRAAAGGLDEFATETLLAVNRRIVDVLLAVPLERTRWVLATPDTP